MNKCQHIKQLLCLFMLVIYGCAQHKTYALSEKHLSREAKKEKAQKKSFAELPPAVKDTIEGTFEWYDRFLKDHPGDYLTTYPSMITLDTALKFENVRSHESYEKAVASASYRRSAGQFFSIAGREFKIPAESQIVLRVIYQGKLFLMGAPLSEEKKFLKIGNRIVITTDNSNHAYWIVPL